jgi:hypothetical protein
MNINYHASFKLNFKKAEKDKTPHSEKHTLPFLTQSETTSPDIIF